MAGRSHTCLRVLRQWYTLGSFHRRGAQRWGVIPRGHTARARFSDSPRLTGLQGPRRRNQGCGKGRGICAGTQGPLHKQKLSSSNIETASFAWQAPGAPACSEQQPSRLGLHVRGFAGAPGAVGCGHVRSGRHSHHARAGLKRLVLRHGEEQRLRQEGPTTSQVAAQG